MIVFSHPRFEIVDQYLETPENYDVVYTFLKKRVDFSLVIPKQNSSIFMIKQYRPGAKKVSIEFPMGTVEGKKDYLEVAKIELEEETGIRAKKWQKLGVVYPLPGSVIQACHIYLAEDLSFAEQKLEKGEFIEVFKTNEAEIEEMIIEGKIFEGVTLSAFMIYKAFKKRTQDKFHLPKSCKK